MIAFLLCLVCAVVAASQVAPPTSITSLTAANAQACPPATSLGAFVVQYPNQSSILVVGMQATIKWSFTPLVKNFPTSLSIRMQQVPAQSNLFPITVADNVTIGAGTRSAVVSVLPLNDGTYRIQLIGDGKLLASASASGSGDSGTGGTPQTQQCLRDGDAIPGVSGGFRVVNPMELNVFPDRFGPVWTGGGLHRTYCCMQLSITSAVAVIATMLVALL